MKCSGPLITILFLMGTHTSSGQDLELRLSPEKGVLMTEGIQAAIDSCARSGGGTVVFSEGTYLTGGLELRSFVNLHLEEGALIQGSDQYSDYRNDAFFYGKGLEHISITGEGIIDGVDCYNPRGEEGFRGPHCIRLIRCKHLVFQDFTIVNSANWAFNLRHCSHGEVSGIRIRRGHDGLHTRFCDHFTVSECDFRTGDDAFAGNDNRNFEISDCKINTSCNGFRMGCLNLVVKRCHLWGPGESQHKIQQRNNMLSAFVHFSPEDEDPELVSGNWLIEDITVENVDRFYVYNFENGLWQTGQPVTKLSFKNINATGILNAFSIIGDPDRLLKLEIANSFFEFREGASESSKVFEGTELASNAFFNAREFNEIEIHGLRLSKMGADVQLEIKEGNRLILDQVHFETEHSAAPYIIEAVSEVEMFPVK